MKEMKAKIEKRMRYWIINYMMLNNKLEVLSKNSIFDDINGNSEESHKNNIKKEEILSKREEMHRMFKNCDDLYLTEILPFLTNLNYTDNFEKKLKILVADIANKIQAKVDFVDSLLQSAKAKRDMHMVTLLTTTERLLKENTRLCFGINITPTNKKKVRK